MLRIVGLILTSLTLLVVADLEAPTSEATFPGFNGKLLLINYSDPGEKLTLINPNGTDREELTGGAARDWTGAWSPDGEQIAFSRGVNPAHIWVMNADGSDVQQITTDDDDDSPAWSPDGTKIAFTTFREGVAEVYVMDANGSNPTNLTNSPNWDFSPAWSPDGEKIAFISQRDGNAELYVMNANGSSQTRLTNSEGFDFGPNWSPDGARIFWSGGDGFVHSIEPDGADEQVLTVAGPGNSPAPSPDGESVAFDGGDGIYIMNPDGSNVTLIPNTTENDDDPEWQPLSEPLPLEAAWGDANCRDGPNPIDGLLTLRHDAGQSAETNECPEMGQEVNVVGASLHLWGDMDCNGTVDPVDALKLLRYDTGLEVQQEEGCPQIGEEVSITP
jgi:Tol biopolymer transport system component